IKSNKKTTTKYPHQQKKTTSLTNKISPKVYQINEQKSKILEPTKNKKIRQISLHTPLIRTNGDETIQ
ncbi:hypothetical protein, partial [Klebsiella pneumoniae]|uniref:hypothetical protein n=1 Tax=Klebsiella pneumoniae TaxID=573 RepID=UPI00272FCF04